MGLYVGDVMLQAGSVDVVTLLVLLPCDAVSYGQWICAREEEGAEACRRSPDQRGAAPRAPAARPRSPCPDR